MADQAKDCRGDVDYLFDIPVELGRELCGYRHDLDLEFDAAEHPLPYEALEAE
ncbi:MAG: hypothetical protein AB7K09_10225 [Planctomycetota bacterium]